MHKQEISGSRSLDQIIWHADGNTETRTRVDSLINQLFSYFQGAHAADCYWPPRARHTSHPMTAIQRSHTKRVKDPNKAATVVKKLATPTAKPEFELHRFAIRRSHLR